LEKNKTSKTFEEIEAEMKQKQGCTSHDSEITSLNDDPELLPLPLNNDHPPPLGLETSDMATALEE
jgi:thiamine biosynthesis lipoprotein ApbE